MRAVKCSQAQIVKAIVVVAGEPGGAFGILPNPFPEAVLDLLLLFPGGNVSCWLTTREPSSRSSYAVGVRLLSAYSMRSEAPKRAVP
jgi:hypothetical protein